MNILKKIFVSFLSLTFLVLPMFVFANENPRDHALIGVDIASQVGYGAKVDADLAERELNKTIALIIQIALSFVGTILLVVIIYGGFLWLTAGGNDDQVSKAKKWITNGVIGMVIITAAYFITDFAIGSLERGILDKV